MVNGILERARKEMKSPDLVIDLLDFSIVWMSRRLMELTGYSEKELPGITVFDLFGYDEDESRRVVSKDYKEHGKRKLTAKTKKGKRFEIETEYCNFEHQKGFYRAARYVKHTKPS